LNNWNGQKWRPYEGPDEIELARKRKETMLGYSHRAKWLKVALCYLHLASIATEDSDI